MLKILLVILCITIVCQIAFFRPLPVSASQAKEYYFNLDPIFENNSEWFGSIADSYKVSGKPCLKHDFLNLLSGNDLKGKQVIKDGTRKKDKKDSKKGKEKYHRSAVDIPLACPKSVSIKALHGDNVWLIQAHDKAVKATLKYIEKNYIYIRETNHGRISVRNTGKSISALFRHSTSRANDPQLHTHVLIINHTLLSKGHYRAIWFDKIFSDQVLINNIYQNELAKRVKQLGYNIVYDKNGKWEIAGIRKEWIVNFSKRSTLIDPAVKKINESNKYPDAHPVKIRNIATLESRPQKDFSVNKLRLKEQWENEVPRESIKKSVEQYKREPQPENRLTPNDYIRLAYQSIHERECLFTRKQIIQASLKLSIGHFTITDIEKAFIEMRGMDQIVDVSKYVNAKGLVTHNYTSQKMKQIEQDIFKSFQQGLNSVNNILTPEQTKYFIDKRYGYFTSDQKKAVVYLLNSKNKFMLIQGDAGTGKTSCLKAFKEIVKKTKNNIEIIGLGYTGKAAQELQTKAEIESRTIASFLNEPRRESKINRFIICDEASMLGSFQTEELFDKVNSENARLVLVGDCKQLQALSAGRLFRDLQGMDMAYIEMNHILRQKTKLMQQAVKNIKDFQTGKNSLGIDETFKLLKQHSCLTEIQGRTNILNSVKNAYLNNKKINDILVITPSNKDRVELNNSIRLGLKKSKKIGGKDSQTDIFVPVNLSGIKPYFAQNYEIGHKALIHQIDMETGGKKWFDTTIIGIDAQSNSLQVLTKDNAFKHIHLRDKTFRYQISLYKTQERNFSINDKVVFLKNDKGLGIQNGLTGNIKKIDKSGIFHIRTIDSKRLVEIDPKNFPWLDHAYAISVHKSQGATSPNVILLADTRYKKLNKTESFYVAVSRAETQVKVFTNDVHRLKEQFKCGQNKTSTLEPKHHLKKSNTKEQETGKEIER